MAILGPSQAILVPSWRAIFLLASFLLNRAFTHAFLPSYTALRPTVHSRPHRTVDVTYASLHYVVRITTVTVHYVMYASPQYTQ